MGSLALVRHGQASFGSSTSSAALDPGAAYDRLSERGAEQARALGLRWATDSMTAIYTGPMRRQVDTAGIAREAARAAGRELPEPIELAGLAELPAFELVARTLPQVVGEHAELRGLLDGSAAAGSRAALWDLAFWKVLEGWTHDRLELGVIESYGAFVDRVRTALAAITARHQGGGERVAAVTSGGPIGVALKLALALTDHAMLALWRVVRNASVTELLWRSRAPAGDLALLGFNHVDHLPPSLQTFR